MKIHPVAEIFPMMIEDELDDLAEDIKANGLQQPIVVDENGILIDGRNRLEACKRAGIKPETKVLDGQDPVAFILSANTQRRNLSKGQIAMILAKVRSCETQDSKTSAKKLGQISRISEKRILMGDAILEYASELADSVLSGAMAIDEAYQTALDRKAAANTAEKQLEKLQAEAPDLFDLVTEDRLKLAEAIATLRNRKEEEKKHRQVTSRLFSEAILLFNPQSNTPGELADHLFAAIDPDLLTIEVSPEVLKRSLEVLKIIVSKWNKQYGKTD